jgi:hypothetical protein
MNSKVDVGRVAALLERDRFEFHEVKPISKALHFIRPGKRPGLFQSAVIEFQGKRLEAVYGGVGVSITRSVKQKEIGEVEWLEELAEDKEELWTIIRTKSSAIIWERRLAEIASERADQLECRIGPDLLTRTAAARHAGACYVQKLGVTPGASQQLAQLRSAVSEEMAEWARRLPGSASVVYLDNADDVYVLACLAILYFQSEVEPGSESYIGQDPWKNRHLLWLIHIVVDELLHRDGYFPSIPK